MMANTATTIKIPTPTPALNIPSIIEQLVNDTNTTKSITILVSFFCMISCFLNCILKCKITESGQLIIT